MKRNRRFVVLASLLTVLFAGCGQAGGMEAVESETISVEKNGRITYYLVGDLDRDYYSLSELSAMAADETARFNKSAGIDGAAVVDRVETLPENARIRQLRAEYKKAAHCGDEVTAVVARAEDRHQVVLRDLAGGVYAVVEFTVADPAFKDL